MTQRGDRTRAKLIEATLGVVKEVGYARASTRAIAEAAGVSEGTIYRHFPDKIALFFAAALEPSAAVLEWVEGMPARAGERTVGANLTEALVRLAELRERVLPLEVAILADPELAASRRALMAARDAIPVGPPEALAGYIAAEQRVGRVRAGVDPTEVAIVLLATLVGLVMTDGLGGQAPHGERLASAVEIVVAGIAAR